ncbi:MAG TPA: 50S ribosomal protein L21 [Candidatus Aminicenantes bacterium]|nr:50S ribosomal protein L21 [Candidatus Aminicenantes bacterium]HPB54363.1 50S ribosomal protein L21 [Candidatus Aminicenantes bacterium]HPS99406.1 50S ribosomal protein L21 [Candidatus Aminicenantes bacterium]
MFAIFESGSKQHLVKEGALVKVEKLGQDDKEIVLDRILMVSSDEKKWVGTPYVEKARIIAENLGDRRDKKVLVFKRKAKKGFKKLIGHRQTYTWLKIQKIEVEG